MYIESIASLEWGRDMEASDKRFDVINIEVKSEVNVDGRRDRKHVQLQTPKQRPDNSS
jgi:hypothetical protein